jgi:hypothetical protein
MPGSRLIDQLEFRAAQRISASSWNPGCRGGFHVGEEFLHIHAAPQAESQCLTNDRYWRKADISWRFSRLTYPIPIEVATDDLNGSILSWHSISTICYGSKVVAMMGLCRIEQFAQRPHQECLVSSRETWIGPRYSLDLAQIGQRT